MHNEAGHLIKPDKRGVAPDIPTPEEWLRRYIDARRDGPPPALRSGSSRSQCDFVRRDGTRCKHPALRGGVATRCSKHGGLREMPEHPSAWRILEAVQQGAATQEIRRTLDVSPPSEEGQRAALDACAAAGISQSTGRRIAGAQAYDTPDGGRAWRRWLDHIDALGIRSRHPSRGGNALSREEERQDRVAGAPDTHEDNKT